MQFEIGEQYSPRDYPGGAGYLAIIVSRTDKTVTLSFPLSCMGDLGPEHTVDVEYVDGSEQFEFRGLVYSAMPQC